MRLRAIRRRISRELAIRSSWIGKNQVAYRMNCGARMLLDTNDVLGKRIIFEGRFEPKVRHEFLRLLSREMNVIDIGANIGYYSILAATVIAPEKRVFSIEPQPNVVKKLQRNIDLNQFSNVSVYPLALSDSPGHVTFYLPEDGDEAMGSLRSNGRFKVAKTVEVETRRLDDLLADLGDPEIGLVKMDAEGAELLILRGATRLMSRSNKPTIIFESNEDNCKPFGYTVFELLQFVANQGYQLRQLDHEDWVATPVR